MSDKIMIGGEMYTIFEQYTNKAKAKAYAEVARRTGMFRSIRLQELPKSHPYYSKGKYALAMRGLARSAEGVTAKSMMKETRAPSGSLKYNKKTGRVPKW